MINGFGKKVYLAGICGISMSAIAIFLKSNGHEVAGSDEVNSGETYENLISFGISVFSNNNHDAVALFVPDSFIYSVAIKEDNPEFSYALKQNFSIFSRGEALGVIAREYEKVIAVSGSHGKTTTTSLVSHILTTANLDPTCHIGGKAKNLAANFRLGSTNNIFVTEACEYYDSFLNLSPYISVVLNIGEDHLDYFKTVDNLKNSFLKFLQNTDRFGHMILNIDDENICEIMKSVGYDSKIISFSFFNKNADVYIERFRELHDGKMVLDCVYFGETISEIYVPLVGKFNLYNVMVSIIVSKLLGVDNHTIRKAIASFEGVSRRYEYICNFNGVKVIHDYAHHPDEIVAVIDETVKFAEGRVFVVFQPHTYSRTKALWDEFIFALKKAYRTILYPIYPAREKPIENISSENLCQDICRKGGACYYCPDYESMLEMLKRLTKEKDIVLILGAGDIVNFTKYILSNNI